MRPGSSTTNRLVRTTPIDDWPLLLRPEEAADILGISKGLVYAMASRDELPSVRLGRLLRVPRDGVIAMLKLGNGRG